MSLLPPSACHDLFEQVLRAARSRGIDDIEVTLGADRDALTRFANNTIHQNVAERSRYLSVRPVIGGRTARASTNRLDDRSIDSIVEQAIAITRASEPDPDLPPLAEAWPVATVDRHHAPTAACTPAERAAQVAAAIDAVRSQDQTAAGIYSTSEGVEAILNSNGAFVYHAETMAEFSVTAMATDSSGWAKASATRRDQLDARALAERAASKTALSAKPTEVSPGRYTVILEPSAVLDLTGELFGDFSATAMEDKNSFLNQRLGKKIFGGNITIVDDAHHPLQDGAPFDGEGVARAPLSLIADGVPTDVAYSRKAARKAGVEPTGHGFALPNDSSEAPANIVFEGGNTSLDEMIA
ncbi:MAG: TldD/PmbA family protein, partial [bacterium]|nr:TldD/PmbA family protein [bacterium]